MKRGRLIAPIQTLGDDGDIVEIYTLPEIMKNFKPSTNNIVELDKTLSDYNLGVVGFVKSDLYTEDNHDFVSLLEDEVDLIKIEKPPLGIMPRKIFEENMIIERINDLNSAIQRYYNAQLEPNKAWFDELEELRVKLKSFK